MSNTTTFINILYFAALGDKLKTKQESFEMTRQNMTVSELQNLLCKRGNSWLAVGEKNIRCAVNQCISSKSATIHAGDEIAFFPPVTGG